MSASFQNFPNVLQKCTDCSCKILNIFTSSFDFIALWKLQVPFYYNLMFIYVSMWFVNFLIVN
jgi:hypothetical protein